MMRFASIPSSIALRVWRGRQSIAVRSSRAGRRRVMGGGSGIGPRHLELETGERDSHKRRNESCMRLGLNLGYWGLGLTAADGAQLAREAEAAGYHSVWTAEAYGSDAATPLAWFAAQTERIRLGAAILQMPGRSPAMTAMTAVTLDHLSGGRFRLGLGTSGPQVAEGWHGDRWGKPLTKTREYISIVRTALARQTVEPHGEHYDTPYSRDAASGLGKPLKMLLRPLRRDLPIYL